MTEQTKEYVRKQAVGFVPVLTLMVPLAVAFIVFMAKLETRITVVEKTSVTQQALEQGLRQVLKEELRPVLQSHEIRIRSLEIEMGKDRK